MRLLTAHRILVGCFIVFSLFFATREALAWYETSSAGHGASALLSLAAAIGFSLYLRSLRKQGP